MTGERSTSIADAADVEVASGFLMARSVLAALWYVALDHRRQGRRVGCRLVVGPFREDDVKPWTLFDCRDHAGEIGILVEVLEIGGIAVDRRRRPSRERD